MSYSFWRPSDEQRRTILLLEALGLIHDLGKLSDKFLESKQPQSEKAYSHNLLADPHEVYKHFKPVENNKASKEVEKWIKSSKGSYAFEERVDLTDILSRIRFTDWTGEEYSFAELIPLAASPGLSKHTYTSWKGALGKEMQPGLLVGTLHGVAHIEKEGDSKEHQQPYCNVFRASPFGLEERIKTETTQKELSNALKDLPLIDIGKITTSERRDWLEKMRIGMSRGLADNRRPHNEVSLWDWGYTVATMIKAAAVHIYRRKIWQATFKYMPFCTLRINVDRLERYACSGKIGDLLGVRRVLDDAFEEVRKLLEEEYALCNCFYSDETGAYYLFSGPWSCEEMVALRREIQSRFPCDLQPRVHFDEWVISGELDEDKKLVRKLVAEPRKKALGESFVRADNNLYLFKNEWGEERPENAEVCTVCGVRPVGYPCEGAAREGENLANWATQDKAQRRNVCRVCLDRRSRRAQEWANSGLQGTIWTDEVADDDGRLALFVGKLGLESWLDGALLDTIKVESDKTKLPSPARLYRIAETARAFWKGVSDNLTDVVGQRPSRLALLPKFQSSPDLGDFHAYELDVDGVALSMVWDEKKHRFLTAENIDYFTKRLQIRPDELFDKLCKRTFDISEPSEYGRPKKTLLKMRIEDVMCIGSYYPVIPLMAEPSVCMILIPADRALKLAHLVKKEYEKHMGKVRDRLPLHIGLVFCRRRTPIRAILDAGRAMLGRRARPEKRVVKAANREENELTLTLEREGHCIRWHIPLKMGDGETEDSWYPYFFLDTEGDNSKAGENNCRTVKVSCPTEEGQMRDCYIVHAADLCTDKTTQIWPSTFDFEYLDTTGRRFDIYYDEDGRRPRRTRPFYLEDLDRLEELWKYMKHLTKTQRQQVIRTIEATRETWHGQDQQGRSVEDDVFKQFVADTLAGAAWPEGQPWSKIPEEWRDKLIQAGVCGELTDLAELHMEILKE